MEHNTAYVYERVKALVIILLFKKSGYVYTIKTDISDVGLFKAVYDYLHKWFMRIVLGQYFLMMFDDNRKKCRCFIKC